jgi:hypothetical protein
MPRHLFIPVLAFALVLGVAGQAAAAVSGGWSHLGHGSTTSLPALNQAVYALNNDEPGVLLVGGAFTNAGGHAAADYIASWNGTAWSALGNSALNGNVRAIAYHDGKVYAGGNFTNAAGNDMADYLAVWNGSTWSPFCTPQGTNPAFNGSVLALQIIGNRLYVGGSFSNGAGITSADFLVSCDLTTGAPSSTVLNADGMNGGVYALTADVNGVLYAGGLMINVDHIAEADHVAKYDGMWHAMGAGPAPLNGAVEDIVRSLAAHGSDIYVGTDSVNVGAIAQADHVARWNGSAWSAVGANTAGTDGWFPASSFIYGLTTYSNVVVATGSFQNANGSATADEIAYFDGTTWHPLGSDGAGNGPLTQQGTAVSVFKGALVVGGSFINGGADVLADYVAAFPLKRPDARIGTSSTGPFTGNDVYSATGVGESKSISIIHGHSGTLYADIQNDGAVAASFTLKGSAGSNGFTVSYFKGTVNITSAVQAGTYATGSLAPSAHVTVKITMHAPTAIGNTAKFRVTATSSTGNPADAVVAKASST